MENGEATKIIFVSLCYKGSIRKVPIDLDSRVSDLDVFFLNRDIIFIHNGAELCRQRKFADYDVKQFDTIVCFDPCLDDNAKRNYFQALKLTENPNFHNCMYWLQTERYKDEIARLKDLQIYQSENRSKKCYRRMNYSQKIQNICCDYTPQDPIDEPSTEPLPTLWEGM